MTLKDCLERIDRRTFLKIVSFTGITGLIYPRQLIASLIPTTLSRVIVVEDSNVTKGKSVNEKTVQIMVDSGIKSLTQEEDIGKAWKTLFPNISPSSVIAIKLNLRYPALPSHPQVTAAVIEGLKQMPFDGLSYNENNIIIYDNWKCDFRRSGYTVNKSDTGVRCFDTDSTVGYSNKSYDTNGNRQKISRIITDMADYLINISVLKNHGDAGITLCLKNHFGSIDRPRDLHWGISKNIPAVNALPPIKNKQCLNICDALFGVKSGGPRGYPQFVANKLLFSRDVVATDYWGRKILEENGCRTTTKSYRADHVDIAATEYNLGTNDPSQMDVVNIKNPSVAPQTLSNNLNGPGNFLLQQNHPNPFYSHTKIPFYISKQVVGKLTISDPAGRRICGLVNQILRPGWHHVPWNGCDDSGKKVSNGVYICQFETQGFKKAIIMQLT